MKTLKKIIFFFLKPMVGVTTLSKHDNPVAENILDRDFTSNQLGEKWVSDTTYISVGKQWNYLTTIIDLADRKIIGCNLSEDMTTENTVYKAWVHARNTKNIDNNLIFHSYRNSMMPPAL